MEEPSVETPDILEERLGEAVQERERPLALSQWYYYGTIREHEYGDVYMQCGHEERIVINLPTLFGVWALVGVMIAIASIL